SHRCPDQLRRRREPVSDRLVQQRSLVSGTEFEIFPSGSCHGCRTKRHGSTETRRYCQCHRNGRQVRAAGVPLWRRRECSADARHGWLGQRPGAGTAFASTRSTLEVLSPTVFSGEFRLMHRLRESPKPKLWSARKAAFLWAALPDLKRLP